MHATGSQINIQALWCKNPQCPKKLFWLFDEWDFSHSVCLWLRLNSEYKIKHFKQNRSERTKALWSLGSAPLFAYQQWTPRVAGKTGVPRRYAATKPNEEPYLGREQVQQPCLHTPPWMPARSLPASQDCWTTEEIQIDGQGERKRAEESKHARRIYIISSLFFNIPTSSPRVPVNSLGTGGFDLQAAHSFQHRTGLCNPLVNYWWATPNFCSLFWIVSVFLLPGENSPATTKHCQIFAFCVRNLSRQALHFFSFRCLTFKVPCLMLLPFQRMVTMALKARDEGAL